MKNSFSGLLVGLLMLFVHCTSTAQVGGKTKPATRADSTARLRPWDVSMDLYGLFKGGPLKLMLRRMSKKNGAYRMEIWGGISKTRHHAANPDSLTFKAKHWSIGTTLGYEWQKNVKKHQLFYGVDLTYFYASDGSSPGVNPYHESRVHLGSIEPFIGVKYRILPQLSLSVETSAGIGFHQQSHWDHEKNQSEGYSRTIGVGFIPFKSLRVVYHF